MVFSADFEKQKQYFDQKILLYQNIAMLLSLFIAILLATIARLTRAIQTPKSIYLTELGAYRSKANLTCLNLTCKTHCRTIIFKLTIFDNVFQQSTANVYEYYYKYMGSFGFFEFLSLPFWQQVLKVRKAFDTLLVLL